MTSAHGDAAHEQLRFFLERRDRSLAVLECRRRHAQQTRSAILGAVPRDWRTTAVRRAALDRSCWSPTTALVLGQDGLVANVAKCLSEGRPVIGFDPEPDRMNRQQPRRLILPGPHDGERAYFVREAWPSDATATRLTLGTLAADETLVIVSELGEGVVFGDGIERDRVRVDRGQRIEIGASDTKLRLVE